MHMILADHPFDNPNLKGFAGLPHQFSNSLTDIPDQYFVTILGYPYKMIFRGCTKTNLLIYMVFL